MKKIFSTAIFMLSAMIFCGCANKTEKVNNGNAPDTLSTQDEIISDPASTTEITYDNAAPDSPADSVSSAYIKDNAGVMSSEDILACDQVISELSSSRMMNAAVVTVKNLDGMEPYEYAAQCYNQIFGADTSRGILFLINNDTNEDILYKAGTTAIDPETEKNALYHATKDIAGDDYGAAAVRMLRLGESCTSHIFDQAGLFTAQQIADLENATASYGTELSIYTVNIISEISADTNKILCQRRYPDKNGIMLMIDCDGRTTAYSDTTIPQELQTSSPKAPIANNDALYVYLLDLLTERGIQNE